MADNRTSDEIERDLERERESLKSTVHELQDTFSTENLVRAVADNFRTHGGDVGRSISTAARDNPLALALTGIGLGWLIFGQGPSADRIEAARRRGGDRLRSVRSTHRDDGHLEPRGPVPAGDDPDWVTGVDRGPSMGQRARASWYRTTRSTSERLGAAGQSMSSGMHSVSSGVSSGAQSAGRSVSDSARATRDRMNAGAVRVRDRSNEIARSLSEGTHNMSEAARERVIAARERAILASEAARRSASRGMDQAADMFEEHPLVMGALAFAVGAAIAGTLPRTRYEDEYFGEDSDRLYHEAEEIFNEEMSKAQRVAGAALGEARRVGEEFRSDAETAARDAKARADRDSRGEGSAADALVDRTEESARRVADAARSEAEKERLGKPGS
ncbi:DUF3618 domain-containing protein [Roseivivax sp. CAU 1761]